MMAPEFLIKKVVKSQIKEGLEKQNLHEQMADYLNLFITVFREEVPGEKHQHDDFLRNCLETALEEA